jgi:biopolymer transport protein ExbD
MIRKSKHELPEQRPINMTPMIDVSFQLILFFVLTSTIGGVAESMKTKQIELNLPESATAEKTSDRSVLSVTYRLVDGQPEIQLNDAQLDGLASLGGAMHTAAGDDQQPQIALRIERTVPYQDVVALMDSVRGAGFSKFSLLTLPAAMGGTK